ncbi:MAG: hypothetical protein Q9214_006091 [Letrouitia sp. 1 TL-2023]
MPGIPAAEFGTLTEEDIAMFDEEVKHGNQCTHMAPSLADLLEEGKKWRGAVFDEDDPVDIERKKAFLEWHVRRCRAEYPNSNCKENKEFYLSNMQGLRTATEAIYNTIIEQGGRPSRPIQYDAGHWVFEEGVDDLIELEEGKEDEETRELHWTSRHWDREVVKFRIELDKWEYFQHYWQRYWRKKPSSLWKIQQRIDEYWQKNNLREQLKPQLHIDPHQQSKVDEWREYYWYRHYTHDEFHCELRVKDAEETRQLWLEEFDTTTCQKFLDNGRIEKRWLRDEWVSRQEIIDHIESCIQSYRRDRDTILAQVEKVGDQLQLIEAEVDELEHVQNSANMPTSISLKGYEDGEQHRTEASLTSKETVRPGRKTKSPSKQKKDLLNSVHQSRVSKPRVKISQSRRRQKRSNNKAVKAYQEGGSTSQQQQRLEPQDLEHNGLELADQARKEIGHPSERAIEGLC